MSAYKQAVSYAGQNPKVLGQAMSAYKQAVSSLLFTSHYSLMLVRILKF